MEHVNHGKMFPTTSFPKITMLCEGLITYVHKYFPSNISNTTQHEYCTTRSKQRIILVRANLSSTLIVQFKGYLVSDALICFLKWSSFSLPRNHSPKCRNHKKQGLSWNLHRKSTNLYKFIQFYYIWKIKLTMEFLTRCRKPTKVQSHIIIMQF